MADRLPDNELVIHPDAGHGGIFQCHDQFVPPALAFLARRERQRNGRIGEVRIETPRRL